MMSFPVVIYEIPNTTKGWPDRELEGQVYPRQHRFKWPGCRSLICPKDPIDFGQISGTRAIVRTIPREHNFAHIVRSKTIELGTDSNKLVKIIKPLCIIIYTLVTVCGYKAVIRFFPHHVSDLEQAV